MSHHPHSIPGPATVTREVTSNGIRLLVRENHAVPVVVLHGSLPAGSLHEPAAQAGLASFTASMLSRGSARYDFDTFNEAIESVGGNLTFGADIHSTDFSITCLSEDFPSLVAILADALRRPTFPVEQVERVRQQRLVALQERDEDTSSVASLRFDEAIFGRTHPYGRATGGYVETLDAIRHDDLAAFHARRYTPHGMVVAVAGAMPAGAVLELLDRHFGDWQGPAADQSVPPFPPAGPGPALQVTMPGKVQADIVIGSRAIARHDPDYYAVRVANCILGQFGLMGRLGERVREEQGLAYHAYSSTMAELAGGTWQAAAGVNPGHVRQAVESIVHEFGLLSEEGVGAEELADTQAYLTGVVPLTLETNDGVANMLLSLEWFDLGLDYLLRYHDLICAVTADDVQRVTRTYLRPEFCQVVVAGPGADNSS